MTKTAYFAGGCFWCITPTFDAIPGVLRVTSGYSGGAEANPSYEDVKDQKTGHRETVRVEYDPDTVSFSTLLGIFMSGVDPFDPGGQFIDRGHSYTLAIYWLDRDQRLAAEAALAELEAQAGRKPCIALEPFHSFWEAEEYHQDYYKKNPEAFRRELLESGRVQQ